MSRSVVNKFNRGEVDVTLLAREDVERVNNSAESMVNFMPMRSGPMFFRPGTSHVAVLTQTDGINLVPFIASVTDTALLYFHGSKVDFIVNDVVMQTTAVTSDVLNDAFTTGITSWSTSVSGGATVSWYDYGGGDGAAQLRGDGNASAIMYQTVTSTQAGVSTSLRIKIDRAPVTVKIGTSGQSSTQIFNKILEVGEHVLTFTPASNITITFENSKKYATLINSVEFDKVTQTLSIPTGIDDSKLGLLRYPQSSDVIYFAYDGGEHFKVTHRGDKSWSVTPIRVDDGPFQPINSTNITLTPGALSGDTTLTASAALFNTNQVNGLFKIGSQGQKVTATVSVDTGAGTGNIRVTGVGASSRSFTVTISGVAGGATITLQRSADESSWEDANSYTANTSVSYQDNLDNAVLFYRLFVKAGNNPGLATLVLTLTYAAGSINGICRVTKFTSATVVDIQVLNDFGSVTASRDWYQGSWSADKQYPAVAELEEGRVWYGGIDQAWGSVSDAFDSFDIDIEGDSASIQKTIGFGPRDPIKWMEASNRLVVGTSSDEIAIRSTSFGEPLTKTTANLKRGSAKGSSNVRPIVIDTAVYFIQRSGVRMFALESRLETDKFEVVDINVLNRDILLAGVVQMDVLREPETRIFVTKSDGTAAIFLSDPSEDAKAWSRFVTDGSIKFATALPALTEDRLYLAVERTVNGSQVLHLEKMARTADVVQQHFDDAKSYTSPGTTITGLGHLQGRTVGVWADGQDRGDFVVSSSQIVVPSSWTSVEVGLRYTADSKSNKLGQASSPLWPQTSLATQKQVVNTALIMKDFWPGSVQVGPSVARLRAIPSVIGGVVAPAAVVTSYTEVPFPYGGFVETDPRIFIRATGPCTILALTYDIYDPQDKAARVQ